ncbi:hypothetical protein ACFL4Y_03945, partial [Gemmatimonadota bacterium]
MSDSNSRQSPFAELLKVRLAQQHSYHDHKETMAHAALLVGLVLLSAILSTKDWPPQWVPDVVIPGKFV